MYSKLELLAHDLRAPLTALKIATGLLAVRRQAQRNPDVAVLVGTLERNLARLERIADELTALANREGGPAVGSKPEPRHAKALSVSPSGRQARAVPKQSGDGERRLAPPARGRK